MTSAERERFREIETQNIRLKRRERDMLQQIADLQTAVTKLEGDVTALEGKVMGDDDVAALQSITASITALDQKIAPAA
jgi:hypothetical protein